jgi:hypothetical protein
VQDVERGTRLTYSVGAGTVEFIMDAETGEYFFMEMYVLSSCFIISSISTVGGGMIDVVG